MEANLVREIVPAANISHRTAATNPLYLTKFELAERLRVTPRTIEFLVNRGKLPCIKIGARLVRFAWADVEAALKAHRVN